MWEEVQMRARSHTWRRFGTDVGDFSRWIGAASAPM
jgi:hypothetical protein